MRLRYQYKDPDTGEEEEILIENTESRKQLENRENAMRLLKSQLYDRALQKRKAKQAESRGRKEENRVGEPNTQLRVRRPPCERPPYELPDIGRERSDGWEIGWLHQVLSDGVCRRRMSFTFKTIRL